MRKLSLLVGLMLVCGVARAGVIEDFMSQKAYKPGIILNIGAHQILTVNNVQLVNVGPLSFDAGVIRTDGVDGALAFNFDKVKANWIGLPVLDLAKYVSIGYGVGYQNVTLSEGFAGNPKDDNHFAHGIYVTGKLKF